MNTATCRYVKKSFCEAIVLDGETMILNPAGFTLSRISPVGGFCWSLLESEQSVDSLSAKVREHYQGTHSTVEQEISSFLENLLECGLIEKIQ